MKITLSLSASASDAADWALPGTSTSFNIELAVASALSGLTSVQLFSLSKFGS
jgi:hypothetical protein